MLLEIAMELGIDIWLMMLGIALIGYGVLELIEERKNDGKDI